MLAFGERQDKKRLKRRYPDMDIDIELECGHCGCIYRESFLDMPNSRVLKCPFCFCTALTVRRDLAAIEGLSPENFSRLGEELCGVERKFKL